MNKRNMLWSALIASSPAPDRRDPRRLRDGNACPVQRREHAPSPFVGQSEASLVDMRDAWLFPLGPEVGLTVGRDSTPRFSVELTGKREVSNADRRLVIALAAGRWAALVSTNTGTL